MIVKHLENAITHVLSQIVGRWIPIPHPECCGIFDDNLFDQYSISQMTNTISEIARDASLCPAWAKVLYGKLDGRVHDVVVALKEHLDAVRQHEAFYLLISDERYPDSLRKIKSPPAALTLCGHWQHLSKPRVAMIGSRKASPYAIYETEKLAMWLTDYGFTIVSGGAYGCDIAAHMGALNSGCHPVPSVVVFPCGVGRREPVCNQGIFAALIAEGALFLSERLWFAGSLVWDYHARNRIIAGLCHHILVMQAGLRSGSMNTALQALDEGREVSILRHPDGDVRADGSFKLIDEGAKSFCNAEEFFIKCMS